VKKLWVVARWTFALALAGAAALAVAVFGWSYPASTLRPDVGGPLIVTDAHGTVLRSVPSADGRPGREAWVPLERIPAAAISVVLASEDARFFAHPGVDPVGLARAAWLDLRGLHAGYGGSTLTMQLVRMVDSSGARRTVGNKIKEIVLALRLERAMGKREILEQYLNRAYYGNGAYGIEAAAELYFGKPAAGLSVGEATLLAVVPRAPSAYDPVRRHAEALARRDHVFGLLAAEGLVSRGEIERARAEPLAPALHPPPFRAPHFVDWVLAQLPDDVKARGGVVTTTLDLGLQEGLEHRLAEHVAGLEPRGLHQAGVVVLETQTGAVRAMVGSAGFDAADGQVNIVARRRHPGSALKPFVYALALEAGDTPATIAYDVADVPSEYRVLKVTQPEHGPVRYREALAGSYNLAAVHVLEKVGVNRLLSKLREAGIPDLDGGAGDYGLRLALGSAKVRLVDLAAAYGFLGRGGTVTRPGAVAEVAFADGSTWRPPRARPTRLFSPETSWLVMDMLSDEEARHPVFGQELPLEDLGFPVAAKTGTSRGFADTVAVAVTRELTVAAWAGNFDGRPTEGLIAMRAAAPLVRSGILLAARGRGLTLPARPDDIVAVPVCARSGMRPTATCPHRKLELFVRGHEPHEPCDWHTGGPDAHLPDAVARWDEDRRTAGGRLRDVP